MIQDDKSITIDEIEEIMDDEEDLMIIRRNKLFSNIVEILSTGTKQYFYVGTSSAFDDCRIGMWFAGNGADIDKSLLVDKDLPIYNTFVEDLQKYLKANFSHMYKCTHSITDNSGSCTIYDERRAVFIKAL